MIKLVIWDWNGTLLDDTLYSMNAMNILLNKHNKPMLTLEKYRSIFNFPVINYYTEAGFVFDETPFAILSENFISQYQSNIQSIPLKQDVKKVLTTIEKRDIKQVLLSATEINNLKMQVKMHQLEPFFDEIIGIDNIHAASKIAAAQDWAESKQINQNETILIGDTLHDFEVANCLGIKCLLLSDGHHNVERLQASNAIVLANINEVLDFI